MVRSHTKSYIHTPAVKNVIKNSASWTTESSFTKMLVNVLFLDITRVVNSFVALAFNGGVVSESCSGCFISEGRKRLWYPFARRLGGSRSWYGCGGEDSCTLGIEPCCQSICQLNYCNSVYCTNSWQKNVLWLTLVHWFCMKFVWLITLPALDGVPNKCHSETVTIMLNRLYLLTRYDALLRIQHTAQWRGVVPPCNSKSSAW